MNRFSKHLAAIGVASCATLLSSSWPTELMARYTGIMGCETACRVAGAGWPFPFLVDYPGLSPAGSASLVGAVLGVDMVRPGALAMSFVCWWVLAAAALFLTERR